MKNFDELLEDIQEALGEEVIAEGVIGTYEINHLEKFFSQISSAYQPSVDKLVNRIEEELNKFGYTFGDMDDVDDDAEEDADNGEEHLLIFNYSTDEMVENVFVKIEWQLLNNGVIFNYRQDGSALNVSAEVTLQHTTPEELHAMISSFLNSDESEDNDVSVPDEDDYEFDEE